MLIKTEDNQRKIDAEESFHRGRFELIKSEKDHQAREARPFEADKAGMDVTNAAQRIGRPMSAWSIQQKLQKIRSFLVFERSDQYPTKTGIYITAPEYRPDLYKGQLIFIGGMESGVDKDGVHRMIPEFSIIVPEQERVPDPNYPGEGRLQSTMKCEIRGWRSVLAMLLKDGVISAHDVEKHFQVSLGRDSQRWQEVLQGRIEIISQTEETNGRAERSEAGAGTATADGAIDSERERGGLRSDGSIRRESDNEHDLRADEGNGDPDVAGSTQAG